MYGVGSPGLDPPDGVDDADLAFDLDLLQETRHRTEQTATPASIPGDMKKYNFYSTEQTATASTVPKNKCRVNSSTTSSPVE